MDHLKQEQRVWSFPITRGSSIVNFLSSAAVVKSTSSSDAREIISSLLILHISGETEFTKVCLYGSRKCFSLSRFGID